MARFKQHRERLAAGLAAQVVGRLHEEGLYVERRAGTGLRHAAHVLGEVTLPFQAPRRVIERRREAVRRVVTVDAGDELALFVEQQHGRGELHGKELRQFFFAPDLAVEPGHLAVTEEVEADGDEVLRHLVHDVLLREAGRHQLLAVGAALLAEIEQQALARLRRLGGVVRQFEEGLGKGRRQDFVADLGKSRRWQHGEQQRQDAKRAPHQLSTITRCTR